MNSLITGFPSINIYTISINNNYKLTRYDTYIINTKVCEFHVTSSRSYGSINFDMKVADSMDNT